MKKALSKKAKHDNDVVWVTAQTESGAKALKCSLSGVLTAVAVPVCHPVSNTNITVIYFSVRKATNRPEAIEFLIHMSLAAAVAGVNHFTDDDQIMDISTSSHYNRHYMSKSSTIHKYNRNDAIYNGVPTAVTTPRNNNNTAPHHNSQRPYPGSAPTKVPPSFVPEHHYQNQRRTKTPDHKHEAIHTSRGIRPVPLDNRSIESIQSVQSTTSVTGANLNLTWSDLRNIEYLTDGGNNWIHTAVMDNQTIVIKQLKPEVQDVSVAMQEIEGELAIHARLDHENIVALYGAGFTTNKSRFLVMERLDGGTLTQQLGYNTRIRDRRKRFWKKPHKMPYIKVLECALQMSKSMDYCHRLAIKGCMVLHRDLKPDNIGEC